MKGRHGSTMILLLLTTTVLSACGGSGGNSGGTPAKESSDPVKLTFYARNVISDEDFNVIFTEPLKRKYPHITLEKIDAAKTKIEDLIVAGNTPDIIFTWGADLKTLDSLNLLADQSPLIKQQNIDLNRFDPIVLSAAKDEKGLYALPLAVQFNALYYNKDIFDKFGVPYPKDGMTWDDAIELAKKMSRVHDGIEYRGMEPESLNRMAFSKSLVYVDAKTEKAAVNSGEWKRIFEMMHTIYNIPNNKPKDLKKATNVNVASEAFVKDRTVAMWPTVNVLANLIEGEKQGLNWDMAQYPSYKETPNVYGTVDAHFLFVTPGGKHQSDAMKVIDLVTSDEVQTISTRKTGRFTPLVNQTIKKQFMADNPSMKTKNVDAIMKSKNAPPQVLTKYEGEGRGIAYAALVDYVDGKIDLNTMIRNTEEAINKKIESLKAAENKPK